MTISELSTRLRELSDDYASQRLFFDEYRLKRKYLLDDIDQRLNINDQQCEHISGDTEKITESDDKSDVVSETINTVFDTD